MNKDEIKKIIGRLFTSKRGTKRCKCGVYLYRDFGDDLYHNTNDGRECYFCRKKRLEKWEIKPLSDDLRSVSRGFGK